MSRLKARIEALAGRVEWKTQVCDYVQGLAWSPDRRWLAAAAVSGPIAILEASTGGTDGSAPGHASALGHDFGTTDIHWRCDSRTLASSGQDGSVRIWDSATGKQVKCLSAGTAWVERVAWSPDGTLLAAAAGRVLRIWTDKGDLIHETSPHPSTIADLTWMPGDNTLAVCAYGGVVLWKPGVPEPVERFAWKGSCLALACSPTGRFIAVGNQDATVLFLRRSPRDEMQMWGYATKVRELAWSSSGRYLATGGSDTVVVWDTAGKEGPRGSKPIMLRGHDDVLTCLAYQPGKDRLASGAADGRVLLWEPRKSKRALGELPLDGAISRLAWSPDGQLAAGTENGTIVALRVGR